MYNLKISRSTELIIAILVLLFAAASMASCSKVEQPECKTCEETIFYIQSGDTIKVETNFVEICWEDFKADYDAHSVDPNDGYILLSHKINCN